MPVKLSAFALALTGAAVFLAASQARPLQTPRVANPSEKTACPATWRAKNYARKTKGLSFALNCGGEISGFETWRLSNSASTGKALLLVSYLRSGRNPGSNRSDLKSMIKVSDNSAATRIYNQLGDRPLRKTLRRARMGKTRLCGCWASIRWSPRDYSRLFMSMPDILPTKHRWWAMKLFKNITPSQKWGIPRQSQGWRTYLKGGWRPEAGGWIVLQGALLKKGDRKLALAVFTRNQPSLETGARKIERVTRLLLKQP